MLTLQQSLQIKIKESLTKGNPKIVMHKYKMYQLRNGYISEISGNESVKIHQLKNYDENSYGIISCNNKLIMTDGEDLYRVTTHRIRKIEIVGFSKDFQSSNQLLPGIEYSLKLYQFCNQCVLQFNGVYQLLPCTQQNFTQEIEARFICERLVTKYCFGYLELECAKFDDLQQVIEKSKYGIDMTQPILSIIELEFENSAHKRNSSFDSLLQQRFNEMYYMYYMVARCSTSQLALSGGQ